jgi:hypothetical protein
MNYSSTCLEVVGNCARYQHLHCADCNAVIALEPGGGLTDGAEDCTECDSILCHACGGYCPDCLDLTVQAIAL